jgi:hypothetical protein
VQYCEWFQDFVTANEEHILDVTFFSDEVWYPLSVYMNSQNSHVWLVVNPHAFQETPLHDKKVGVWCVISQSQVIGPIFFEIIIVLECYMILYLFIG